jgi:hypothetical protein
MNETEVWVETDKEDGVVHCVGEANNGERLHMWQITKHTPEACGQNGDLEGYALRKMIHCESEGGIEGYFMFLLCLSIIINFPGISSL